MNWSILCSGPYIEALSESYTPELVEGIFTFKLPLAEGAMPYIHLDDLGLYALWIFTNPEQSRGLNLEIGTVHASGNDIAAAFTATTGQPARYEAVELQGFLTKQFGSMPRGADTIIGEDFAPGDKSLMTYRQNFTAWWEIYRACGGNTGIIKRDYEPLDRILPGRVRSVEEWMRKVKYTGDKKPLLKQLGGKAKLKDTKQK